MYNETTRNRIVRLNTDGTLDGSFNMENGFNNIVYSIAIQEDGKILIGGNFSVYNEILYDGIIRINSDGSVEE